MRKTETPSNAQEMLNAMIAKNGAKTLHDKATRSVALTDEEQAMLAKWYGHEEEAEPKLL